MPTLTNMSRLFHVTSSSNRASIDAHGLDWQLMGPARGIAGSIASEVDGIFVCTDASDVDFFVGLNNTGGPVDVWAIDGVDTELVETGAGFRYVPHAIPRAALALIRRDLPPQPQPPAASSNGEGFTSELTISFND